MGNSVIESFWQYSNICIRNLSDEEYESIGEQLQHIVWAWNTTVHTMMEEWPSVINMRTNPVTFADSLMLPLPTNDILNMSNIHVVAMAYTMAAWKHGDFVRKQHADILN